MSAYPDAVGYMNDLANEANEPWFRMISDLASVCGESTLDQLSRETLYALFTKRASYIGIKPAESAALAAAPVATTDSLEKLSGFTNFKLLSDSLELNFTKRITLVFGTNGSGKSSLCESLKVLASPDQPIRPLQNVRVAGGASPAFHYKFTSDATQQTWMPAVGYGPRQTTVKYFDTAIAIKNVKNAVEPGRIIVVTPFKLHIFEWVKALTTNFRVMLQQAQSENSIKLSQALLEIRTDFTKFKNYSLSAIDEKTAYLLAAQIKLGEEFTDQEMLLEKLAAANELEKAVSEEGLKLLRAEHRELDLFIASLRTLLTSVAGLWGIESAGKMKTLAARQNEQEVLAKALIPKSGTLDGLLALLRAASPLCKMDEAEGHECPLCRRDLTVTEVDLFKRYHDLLAGELEKEIIALKVDITKVNEFKVAIDTVDRKPWGKYTTLRTEDVTAAMASTDLIIANCSLTEEPSADAIASLEKLDISLVAWTAQLEAKKNAIDAVAMGRDELVKQLTVLSGEIEPMEYAHVISKRLENLQYAQRKAKDAGFWRSSLPGITPLLKKITDKSKVAHEELVVADFEVRLNSEYKSLAEKDMAAFGVVLARKGTDAAVTILPHIGDKEIESILSEGEQRVHALALFFAELDTCVHSVLVFDDPISSFDYNYITNYCARLRDLSLKHPSRQIIVLTHNWEFFVQLQTTLNQAGLDSHLSVQVLENCAVVANYSEKIDDLKADIKAVLVATGEPTKAKKEETAGKMRRLIEVVVNTHVFNNQRHQYKQKSQAITAFQSFTKLVALFPAEATTLRDLYVKLCITEHDDPRTAYVNTDKATFQTRYDSIVAIEAAVVSRK